MSEEKIYTLEELKKKLTKKESIFSHEYIIDWNASRAARVAGYSERTVGVIGYENLKKPYIKQYIDFIKNDLEKESGISKLRQLNELAKIAYSNVSEIRDTWIDLKDWEHIKQQNPDIMAAVESIDTKTETKVYNKGGDEETDVEINYVKVKFYPKIPAISEINKMQGYNASEKIDIKAKIEDDIDLSKLTTKEKIAFGKLRLKSKGIE